MYLRGLLEAHRYSVIEACDGKEALLLLSKNPDIQIVLTDNHMPKMNGFELIKQLRLIKTP